VPSRLFPLPPFISMGSGTPGCFSASESTVFSAALGIAGVGEWPKRAAGIWQDSTAATKVREGGRRTEGAHSHVYTVHYAEEWSE
jgi:hypothetical protein